MKNNPKLVLLFCGVMLICGCSDNKELWSGRFKAGKVRRLAGLQAQRIASTKCRFISAPERRSLPAVA